MMLNGKKSLLLITDDRICKLVGELCRHHSDEVEILSNDVDSLEYACSSAWNLLILHPEDSSSTTVEACRRIKAARPYGQIIIIADGKDQAFGARCLYQGADDVVVAPWNDVELSARISVAIRRSSQFLHLQQSSNTIGPTVRTNNTGKQDTQYQHIGDVRHCPSKREVSVLEKAVHLTHTEYLLFSYLFQRTSRPCSSVELLNKVLGYEDENYLPSLHSHISRLRRKINHSRTTSIETIWCYGYRAIVAQ